MIRSKNRTLDIILYLAYTVVSSLLQTAYETEPIINFYILKIFQQQVPKITKLVSLWKILFPRIQLTAVIQRYFLNNKPKEYFEFNNFPYLNPVVFGLNPSGRPRYLLPAKARSRTYSDSNSYDNYGCSFIVID